MRVGVLEEQTDLSPADWVVEHLQTFGENVGSIIPEGFEAYGRLFHPAHSPRGEITWSEVAEHNGRAVHPEMQWEGITGTPLYEHAPSGQPWIDGPSVGSLPREQVEVLIRGLRGHTSTPERVWFATWTGWGSHRLDPRPGALGMLTFGRDVKPKPLPRRLEPLPPILELPGRHYYLLGGPIEGALETMLSAGYAGLDPWWQSVNLWWPDDRAWFVSTEIDFAWTYVAGTEKLIDELVDSPRLEVLRAELHHGIAYDSDRLNPPPARLSDPED